MYAGVDKLWRDAGLGDLGLRALRTDDLDLIAAALLPGEGYTPVSDQRETLADIRRGLEGFGKNGQNAGIVATRSAEDAPAAFLLYRWRNRLVDDFGGGAPLGAMATDLFPPDGRFLQIHDLWVEPSLRRHGVARTLKRIIELAAAAEAVRMIYTVTEATHLAALRLNAGLGYIEVYRGPMWDRLERVGLAKYL